MSDMQISHSLNPSTSRKRIFSGTSFPLVLGLGLLAFSSHAQKPSALYTWAGTGNVQSWVKNFGGNTVTLSNVIDGELTITETGGSGADVAISDGPNRVRESSVSGNGGTDLTGLDYLEFDLGHNGAGNINVQFYVQASVGYTFVALGPDLSVSPGVNTYQVPLTGLTPEQAVYVRTMGFNARSHAGLGDVVWTLREVRAGGTPLKTRDLITHDAGTAEGGLQGAIVNFDNASVQGNDGGQNQTGLTNNPTGSGSLQWTDVGTNGAAISWGNGTAWNGNTFNNRETDLSNYDIMTVRISAAEVTPGTGSLNVQAFFQVNNFTFISPGSQSLPTDGQYHDLTYSLAGLSNMNVVDLTGINLGAHTNQLLINVDLIRFSITPTITSVTNSGSDISLTFLAALGQTYSVEYSTDLSPGSFTNTVGNDIIGDGQPVTVTDTNAVISSASRFYRLNAL
jgi:hypothetical protein